MVVQLLSHVENDIHDIPVDIQALLKMGISFSCRFLSDTNKLRM